MVWRGDNVGAGAGRVRRNSSYSADLAVLSWRRDRGFVVPARQTSSMSSSSLSSRERRVARRGTSGCGAGHAGYGRERARRQLRLPGKQCAAVRRRNSSLWAANEPATGGPHACCSPCSSSGSVQGGTGLPGALLRLPRDGLMGGRLKPVKARGGSAPEAEFASSLGTSTTLRRYYVTPTLRPAGFGWFLDLCGFAATASVPPACVPWRTGGTAKSAPAVRVLRTLAARARGVRVALGVRRDVRAKFAMVSSGRPADGLGLCPPPSPSKSAVTRSIGRP